MGGSGGQGRVPFAASVNPLAALRLPLPMLAPSVACRSVMLVGLGGNNGTTLVGGVLANKQ